ncbi:MAG: GIY-YIG nuclease family protein [Candidatus Absconditabacterales bacterium]
MMYFVYVIKSKNYNYIYVGLTDCIERRLSQHNGGKEKTTKHYAPFKLIYTEELLTRIEARGREKF